MENRKSAMSFVFLAWVHVLMAMRSQGQSVVFQGKGSSGVLSKEF